MLKQRNGTNPNTSMDNAFILEPDTLIIENQSLRYGFIQLPRQVLLARNLSHSAKLLYAVLLNYAWQDGACFPGYSRLEEDMQAQQKMIRRNMRELEAVGLVSQKRRGQGKTNIYTLHDLRDAKLGLPESLNGQIVHSRTDKISSLEQSKSPSTNKQGNKKQNNKAVVVADSKISNFENKETSESVPNEIAHALIAFGITETIANRLSKKYPEEHITDKLAVAQWLVDQSSPLVRKNPAGWLKTAIEDDFDPPKDYEPPSARKAKTEKQAAQAEERREAEEDFRRAQEEIHKRIRENHPPEPIGEQGLTTESAWALTLQKMEILVARATFGTLLKNTMLMSVEDNTANVVVPDQHTADWIERRLYQSLHRTFTDIIGQQVDFRFVPAATPLLTPS